MAIHAASWVPGALVRFGSLDFVVTAEGELTLAPPPVRSPPAADFDALAEVLEELRLHPPGLPAPEGSCPPDRDIDWRRLERQLPAVLGPQPSREDLRLPAFTYSNIVVQLAGGEPLPSEVLTRDAPRAFPFGLSNAAESAGYHMVRLLCPPTPNSEFVGMAEYAPESVHDLLTEDAGMTSDSDACGEDYHPSRECFMAETGDGHVASTDDTGGAPREDPEGAAAGATGGPLPPPAAIRASAHSHSGRRPGLEQLRARLQELGEVRRGLEQEHAQLDQEIARRRADGGRARAMARDAQRRIVGDDHGPPRFARASQNIAAAAGLLQGLPEPATPQERRAREEIRELLERAAQQQAESSLSRRHGSRTGLHEREGHRAPEASVRQVPRGARGTPSPIHRRIGPIRDARLILDARRREERNPLPGTHHDRSPSPPPPGPEAFGRHILRAPFPQRYRAPANIPKYSGETNPGLWLEDYQLACQAGGADNDYFIIRNLPLFLADSARTWLEHLPPNSIQDWADLKTVFVGNFQGTYTRPGNPWDLKSCRQGQGESLRDYIRRFSRKCNELPNVADADVISAFLSGTSNRALVHKLGRRSPRTTMELLDIATSHASGEDAVGAIFNDSKGKAKRDEAAVEGASDRSSKNKRKDRPRREVLTATDGRKGKRASTEGTPDHFEKLLEEPCPNHGYPVKHAYKDCGLLKKFLGGGAKGRGEQRRRSDPEGTDGMGKGDGFPTVDACLMIFGGPDAYATKRRQKLERREVYTVEPAMPTYLRWSEAAITFDRSDHPECVPRPGRYPLVVDPIVGTKRLSKVLMDGGSGLNIMYAETLDLMGISRARLRPSGAPFHGIVPGKQAMPLGQIDLPVTFGTPTNYRTETLTFEVVGFHGSYHAVLGRPCYAKFMAVPNYTYLKLKMPGPKGTITVSTSIQRAYECEVECCEMASAVIASQELPTVHEADIDEMPDPGKAAKSFEAAVKTKAVPVDPSCSDARTVLISADLSTK